MKLLIVEDEPGMAESIFKFMQTEDFLCEAVATLALALEKVDLFQYHCIVADITLPDGSGISLLHHLQRLKRKDGIIIISAKGSLEDKLEGLGSGADDYLPKPFHLPELSARIKAIIRRKSFEGSNVLIADGLRIDIDTKEVICNEQHLELTKSEFELLIFFMSNKNKVISKKALAENISGDKAEYFDSYDFIYTHLKNLKKKLSGAGYTDAIKSVYGLGYKFYC
ncbi:response regulator transcription factor [Chitinophaga sancti]|uniref:response regulator transcription factor n=1 Tax=Chitinophaga sancti TaxID=1004 RepID=UPI003F7AA4F1